MPVAVIEARALRSLQRLGSTSPLHDSRTLFETVRPETPQENPLLKEAEQRLHAAEILHEQQCLAGIMDLLASALLLKVTALAGESQIPALATVAVWLYSQIIPKQILTQEQGALVLQVVSLSQSPGLPDPMIQQALADVRELFALLR